MTTLISLLKDKSGATAIEYGLMAGLVSIGMIVGLQAFSDSLLAVFETIRTAILGAGGA
ncbi:Flp family type IVb pilin [Pararhizobium sp. YC-54]|uniref:Flp family type IVb pilin n=1 Tax=Pararhizobium sp. YC-54 TaxID=2986920 RepID=UPI0021F71386|nr:Flp family type IVb pilin [Pararhizobium sp. YC-54]MCW0002069.1 Flp family type IVb pilin [Pararhizobium sp. YC-54]